MQAPSKHRRAHGTGSLFVKAGSWYGQWWVGGRTVKRKIGPRRSPERPQALTRPQAERQLRRLMVEVNAVPTSERITVEVGGKRLIAHREAQGRKRSTLVG